MTIDQLINKLIDITNKTPRKLYNFSSEAPVFVNTPIANTNSRIEEDSIKVELPNADQPIVVIYGRCGAYIHLQSKKGDSMTLDQLKTDIDAVNKLFDVVSNFLPNGQVNAVVSFLKKVDEDPFLLDLVLLVINKFVPTPTAK